MLAVVETHPIQYRAPVYRALAQQCGVPVTVIYGSDFSTAGYLDQEFQTEFAWDTDLLSGYASRFLSHIADKGARTADAVSSRGLRKALADLRPSAVMVVGYSPRFHRAAWLEAWRAGYPILFRGETNDEARTRNRLHEHLRSAALAVAYRRCGSLLYIGTRSHMHFRRHGVPEDRLVFSPYCVDTSAFHVDEDARHQLRRQCRAALGVSDQKVVLLYAGKLSARKGVDLLVGAVRRLTLSLRTEVVVVFLGDGEQRANLQALAGAAPRVQTIFLGFQNQTHLSDYYHAADLLVLPSRHSETWGLVVNEALHHGVPCVVSDQVGCAPDLIDPGVTGGVFKAGSEASLASALESACELRGRKDVRDGCRLKISGYTVERAAAGIALAYAAATATPARSAVSAA